MSGTEEVQRTIEHNGGCHCGAVAYRFRAPERLDVLDCNCSICAMTGFRHVIVPHADFDLRTGGQDLIEYRFNTGKAVHLFCLTCGVKSFYQPRSHPDAWSVNFNCVTDARLGEVRAFDGRNWEASHRELAADEDRLRDFAAKLAEGRSYLDHFASCFLDPNVDSDDAGVQRQLAVDVYRTGLEWEVETALGDPDFSWLDLFTRYWREPDMNGLETEADARDFAIWGIWRKLHPERDAPAFPDYGE